VNRFNLHRRLFSAPGLRAEHAQGPPRPHNHITSVVRPDRDSRPSDDYSAAKLVWVAIITQQRKNSPSRGHTVNMPWRRRIIATEMTQDLNVGAHSQGDSASPARFGTSLRMWSGAVRYSGPEILRAATTLNWPGFARWIGGMI